MTNAALLALSNSMPEAVRAVFLRREFAAAALTFLREKVPQNWTKLRDTVTDNFRVINPKDFRVLA
jgi:hypothetical protein